MISGLQKQVERDEPEEDMMELLAAEQNVAGVPYDTKSDEFDDEISVEGEPEAEASEEPTTPAADRE